MKKFLLAATLAFAPGLAFTPGLAAQTAPATSEARAAANADADPAMWVVRDDDTTIYLFGTFHMLDGRTWFNDEVKTAFDESDELVVEAITPDDPSELQPLILRFAVDPDGRKLSDRLSPEQNEAFADALAEMGLPANALDPLEPWFASLTLVNVAAQKMGIRPEHGADTILIGAARERGIPVSELEGVEWQLSLFDEMSEEQQLKQLRQTLDSLEELDDMLEPMLAAWSTGDVEGLVELMKESQAQDAELHELIFTNRNRTWAEWVQERLERPGTVFVAVGAGHLAGEDSVQDVLAGRGIESRRVEGTSPGQPAS